MFSQRDKEKGQMQKCLKNFPTCAYFFQDILKKKAKCLAHSNNNANPAKRQQKNDICDNEQLNNLAEHLD